MVFKIKYPRPPPPSPPPRPSPGPTVASRVVVVIRCNMLLSHNQVRGHSTGSSHSGVEEYPREKKHKQDKKKVVSQHRTWYIIADAIHASARKIQKVKSGVRLRCCRSVLPGAYVSLLAAGKTDYTPLATQERLPRIYYT